MKTNGSTFTDARNDSHGASTPREVRRIMSQVGSYSHIGKGRSGCAVSATPFSESVKRLARCRVICSTAVRHLTSFVVTAGNRQPSDARLRTVQKPQSQPTVRPHSGISNADESSVSRPNET